MEKKWCSFKEVVLLAGTWRLCAPAHLYRESCLGETTEIRREVCVWSLPFLGSWPNSRLSSLVAVGQVREGEPEQLLLSCFVLGRAVLTSASVVLRYWGSTAGRCWRREKLGVWGLGELAELFAGMLQSCVIPCGSRNAKALFSKMDLFNAEENWFTRPQDGNRRANLWRFSAEPDGNECCTPWTADAYKIKNSIAGEKGAVQWICKMCVCLFKWYFFSKPLKYTVPFVNVFHWFMQSPGINSSCFLLVTLGLGQMEYLCVWWFCLAVAALKLFNSGLFISAFSAEAAQIIWLLSYFSPKGEKNHCKKLVWDVSC